MPACAQTAGVIAEMGLLAAGAMGTPGGGDGLVAQAGMPGTAVHPAPPRVTPLPLVEELPHVEPTASVAQEQAGVARTPPSSAEPVQAQLLPPTTAPTNAPSSGAGPGADPSPATASQPPPYMAPVSIVDEAAKPKYRYVMPPIRYWGLVSYDMRYLTIEEQEPTIEHYLNASINAETFIWQPWFATVSGGLGFLKSTTEYEDGDLGSDSIYGNARLIVFPVSRFPFEAHYDRTDSRTDAANLGTQYISTRYGFTQRYTPVGGDTNYLAIYEHADQERSDGITDSFDGYELAINKRFGPHYLDLNGRYTVNDSSDGAIDNTYQGLALRHTYVPNANWNVENLLNYTDTSESNNVSDVQTRFLQFNDFWSYRSDDYKWYVSGGFRAFQQEGETGPGRTESLSLNAYAGANYQYDRFTRVSGSVNISQTDSGNISRMDSNQNLGVNYQPDVIPLGNIQYQWFAAASVSNRMGDTDTGQHATLQVGHSFDRGFDLAPGSRLSFNFSQFLSGDADTLADSVSRIGNSASINWSMGRGESSAFVRFSASDSRTLKGPEDTFQLLNFQANLSKVQTRTSSWTGNITMQATRNITVDNPNADFSTSSSGDLTYLNWRWLGIRRLQFQSQLLFNENNILQTNSGSLTPATRDQQTFGWENRVDYSIGRSTVSLSARIAEVNGRAQNLLQLRLLRQFGDL